MHLPFGSSKILTLLVLASVLSACITLPGHRQIVEEDNFYLLINTQSEQAKRDIRFNTEKGELVELPPHSSIELAITDENGMHEMVIKNLNSTIEYQYKRNGRTAPFDDATKQWFVSQIPMIIEKTGLSSTKI